MGSLVQGWPPRRSCTWESSEAGNGNRVPSLFRKGGGVYWRNGGVNWRALVSLFLGMAAAMMWIDAAFYVPSYTGPLSSATGGADFSWLVGIIVGGVAYWILSYRSVRAEVAAGTESGIVAGN